MLKKRTVQSSSNSDLPERQVEPIWPQRRPTGQQRASWVRGAPVTPRIGGHLILRVCSPASSLGCADLLRGLNALTLAPRTVNNGLLPDDAESCIRPLHQRHTLVQKLVDVSREAYPSESVKHLSLERLDFRRAIGSTQHPQHHRDLIRREFVEFSRTTFPDNDAGALRTPQDELS